MTHNNVSRRQFLKYATIAGLTGLAHGRVLLARPTTGLTLYVGTYTTGESDGIYVYRMDPNTGQLSQVSSVKSINPSFLALDRKRKFLYAVNEVSNFEDQQSGAVSAFKIEAGGDKLVFVNQQSSSGADPCHLSLTSHDNILLVANYTGGSLAVLPIRRDGSLAAATHSVQHHGTSIREQQKGPHAHCIIPDPSGKNVLATDLGVDKVMIYRLDPIAGKLIATSSTELKPGAGPRHVTFHPNGRFAYVINELDSTVSGFVYQQTNAVLRGLETVSTLPEDFSEKSYCADIHVSPDGRFLYGSNRGHNSIAVFAIDQKTGRLKTVQHVSTDGKWPRNFIIDPSGTFLLVANQHTGNVVTFRIDERTGRLGPTGHVAEIPSPVCLKFA